MENKKSYEYLVRKKVADRRPRFKGRFAPYEAKTVKEKPFKQIYRCTLCPLIFSGYSNYKEHAYSHFYDQNH